MGWSAFGKHSAVINTNLPLSKKKVCNQCVLVDLACGSEIWQFKNMAPQGFTEITKAHTKRNEEKH